MTAEFVSGLSLASLEVILYFTSLRALRCLLHAINPACPKPRNWSSSPESHQKTPHHPATSSTSCECSRAKQRWGIQDWWKRTRPCGTAMNLMNAFWNLWNPTGTQDANSDYWVGYYPSHYNCFWMKYSMILIWSNNVQQMHNKRNIETNSPKLTYHHLPVLPKNSARSHLVFTHFQQKNVSMRQK